MKRKYATAMLVLSSLCALGSCGSTQVDEQTLTITCVKLGYGLDWLYALTNAYTAKTGVKFQINEQIGSSGISAIDTEIKSYAGTADIYGTRPSAYHKYIYRGEITAADGNVYPHVFEDLTDIYTTPFEGETGKNTIQKKMDSVFQEYATVDDKIYSTPWANGFTSFVRNLDVWTKFGYTANDYPRTTDEMFEMLDEMNKQIADKPATFENIKPMIYSEGDEYFSSISGCWFVQYEGLDNMQNFYDGLDINGEQTDDFYGYQGITESANVVAKLVSKDSTGKYIYQHPDSVYEFTQVQEFFLLGASALMVNGTWLEVESPYARQSNLDWVKVPIVSSIVNNLEGSYDDAKLREMVAFIDEHPTIGDNEGMPDAVSEDDLEIVREARVNGSVTRSDFDHQFVVPSWGKKKTMAKNFLKWMYSDEALQLFYDTMNGHHLPATLSQGEYDTSKATLSSFRVASNVILDEGNYCNYLVNTVKNKIFCVANVKSNFSNTINGYSGSFVNWLASGKVADGAAVRKENSNYIKSEWSRILRDIK